MHEGPARVTAYGGHVSLHALVIGGSGILRPLAASLVERGWRVTVVAREPSDEGPGRFVVPADARKPEELARALDGAVAERGSFGLCMVYAPFAPAGSMRQVAARSPGRLVYALTSGWAAPDAAREERDAWAPDGEGSTQRVTLGWAQEDGGTRWHTPAEVSAGVLAALDGGGEEVTLGRVRPWGSSPGRWASSGPCLCRVRSS